MSIFTPSLLKLMRGPAGRAKVTSAWKLSRLTLERVMTRTSLPGRLMEVNTT
jgi:hypothetical protein